MGSNLTVCTVAGHLLPFIDVPDLLDGCSSSESESSEITIGLLFEPFGCTPRFSTGSSLIEIAFSAATSTGRGSSLDSWLLGCDCSSGSCLMVIAFTNVASTEHDFSPASRSLGCAWSSGSSSLMVTALVGSASRDRGCSWGFRMLGRGCSSGGISPLQKYCRRCLRESQLIIYVEINGYLYLELFVKNRSFSRHELTPLSPFVRTNTFMKDLSPNLFSIDTFICKRDLVRYSQSLVFELRVLSA
jgi:hypothetical protein